MRTNPDDLHNESLASDEGLGSFGAKSSGGATSMVDVETGVESIWKLDDMIMLV
jgi:hypothetical protein